MKEKRQHHPTISNSNRPAAEFHDYTESIRQTLQCASILLKSNASYLMAIFAEDGFERDDTKMLIQKREHFFVVVFVVGVVLAIMRIFSVRLAKLSSCQNAMCIVFMLFLVGISNFIWGYKYERVNLRLSKRFGCAFFILVRSLARFFTKSFACKNSLDAMKFGRFV